MEARFVRGKNTDASQIWCDICYIEQIFTPPHSFHHGKCLHSAWEEYNSLPHYCWACFGQGNTGRTDRVLTVYQFPTLPLKSISYFCSPLGVASSCQETPASPVWASEAACNLQCKAESHQPNHRPMYRKELLIFIIHWNFCGCLSHSCKWLTHLHMYISYRIHTWWLCDIARSICKYWTPIFIYRRQCRTIV